MAYTKQEVKNFIDNIYASGGTAADVARAAVEYGVPANQIAEATNTSVSEVSKALVNELYIQQLGRAPDEKGANYYTEQLASGKTPTQIASELNRSLEGQNFDTQYITSLYRTQFERNPEQEGYQYYMSLAQTDPLMFDAALKDAIIKGTQSEVDAAKLAARGSGYTNLELAALEADPYGGRYATQSIYELLPDAVNVSNIGGTQAQFVNPATQQSIISQFNQAYADKSQFSANQGLNVLNTPAAQAAISRALASGTLDQADYNALVTDLTKVQNPEQLRAAFSKPQAQVVLDAIYGQQIGEAKTLADAQAEALQRQAVLNATDQGYYQGNMQLADAYRAAGLDFPFGQEAYQGYDTRIGQANVLNPQNFNAKVNELLSGLNQQFGQPVNMVTPLTGQYYSETGLQPGFTPVGTPGTTFRSGVAGYVPQAQLPTGFQFGVQPVNVPTQTYQPGVFQPAGVTTGGFITGYDANQQPIYSTYNNPNVNVGNVPSTLNPFTNQNQELQNMFTALRPLVTSIQANQG